MHSQQRLNKFLALQLGISRREADDYIAASRVTINGQPAQLGAQAQSHDTITLDSQVVTANAAHIYLLLNKPPGYVCSRKKQGSADTIYSLLPAHYHVLKPVGRLDKDSSGLILLTNDGDLAHRMTHPSFHKTKIYEVSLDHPLQPLHQQMISDFGVMLEDGKSQFLVEKIHAEDKRVASGGAAPASDKISDFSEEGADNGVPAKFTSWGVGRTTGPETSDLRGNSAGIGDDGSDVSETIYQITMREGRNRQIRRTFAALGYTVTRLHRTHFGPYSLGSLPSGHYKPSLPR